MDCGGTTGFSFVNILFLLPVILFHQVKAGYTVFKIFCRRVMFFVFRVSKATVPPNAITINNAGGALTYSGLAWGT